MAGDPDDGARSSSLAKTEAPDHSRSVPPATISSPLPQFRRAELTLKPEVQGEGLIPNIYSPPRRRSPSPRSPHSRTRSRSPDPLGVVAPPTSDSLQHLDTTPHFQQRTAASIFSVPISNGVQTETPEVRDRATATSPTRERLEVLGVKEDLMEKLHNKEDALVVKEKEFHKIVDKQDAYIEAVSIELKTTRLELEAEQERTRALQRELTEAKRELEIAISAFTSANNLAKTSETVLIEKNKLALAQSEGLTKQHATIRDLQEKQKANWLEIEHLRQALTSCDKANESLSQRLKISHTDLQNMIEEKARCANWLKETMMVQMEDDINCLMIYDLLKTKPVSSRDDAKLTRSRPASSIYQPYSPASIRSIASVHPQTMADMFNFVSSPISMIGSPYWSGSATPYGAGRLSIRAVPSPNISPLHMKPRPVDHRGQSAGNRGLVRSSHPNVGTWKQTGTVAHRSALMKSGTLSEFYLGSDASMREPQSAIMNHDLRSNPRHMIRGLASRFEPEEIRNVLYEIFAEEMADLRAQAQSKNQPRKSESKLMTETQREDASNGETQVSTTNAVSSSQSQGSKASKSDREKPALTVHIPLSRQSSKIDLEHVPFPESTTSIPETQLQPHVSDDSRTDGSNDCPASSSSITSGRNNSEPRPSNSPAPRAAPHTLDSDEAVQATARDNPACSSSPDSAFSHGSSSAVEASQTMSLVRRRTESTGHDRYRQDSIIKYTDPSADSLNTQSMSFPSVVGTDHSGETQGLQHQTPSTRALDSQCPIRSKTPEPSFFSTTTTISSFLPSFVTHENQNIRTRLHSLLTTTWSLLAYLGILRSKAQHFYSLVAVLILTAFLALHPVGNSMSMADVENARSYYTLVQRNATQHMPMMPLARPTVHVVYPTATAMETLSTIQREGSDLWPATESHPIALLSTMPDSEHSASIRCDPPPPPLPISSPCPTCPICSICPVCPTVSALTINANPVSIPNCHKDSSTKAKANTPAPAHAPFDAMAQYRNPRLQAHLRNHHHHHHPHHSHSHSRHQQQQQQYSSLAHGSNESDSVWPEPPPPLSLPDFSAHAVPSWYATAAPGHVRLMPALQRRWDMLWYWASEAWAAL